MIGRDFTGYKEVATLTADFIRYAIETESLTPVTDFIQARKITNFFEAQKVCKIARAVGVDVYIKQGVWFERGAKVM